MLCVVSPLLIIYFTTTDCFAPSLLKELVRHTRSVQYEEGYSEKLGKWKCAV